MRIKTGILSVWVDQEIPFTGDAGSLRRSIVEAGFEEKDRGNGRYIYKRGAEFAMTFNYGDEALEVRIDLRFSPGRLNVRVGNRGFPGDIHWMKGRFCRFSEKLCRDIRETGRLQSDPARVEALTERAAEMRGEAKRLVKAAWKAPLTGIFIAGIVIVVLRLFFGRG